MNLLDLPPEPVQQIIRSMYAGDISSRSEYRGRQATLSSLCLVNSSMRLIAQPVLEEALWLAAEDEVKREKVMEKLERRGAVRSLRSFAFREECSPPSFWTTFAPSLPAMKALRALRLVQIDTVNFEALEGLPCKPAVPFTPAPSAPHLLSFADLQPPHPHRRAQEQQQAGPLPPLPARLPLP
jgi:hypothetical protein